MYRNGRLACSVSQELSISIQLYLIKKGLDPKEALDLSRQYNNVKAALSNSSLNKPKIDPNKLYMKNQLEQMEIDPGKIEFLINTYSNLEEALENIDEISSDDSGRASEYLGELKQDEFIYDKITKDDNICCICRDPYSIGERLRALPCMHRYHSECIHKWLTRKNKCPRCLTPA
jgi:Ring finger domain